LFFVLQRTALISMLCAFLFSALQRSPHCFRTLAHGVIKKRISAQAQHKIIHLNARQFKFASTRGVF